MSDLSQRSYERAQRQYDAQLPPNSDDDECPDCEGTGLTSGSNCCGADFSEPGFPDNDICSACHEHAEPDKCERCDGSGKVDAQAERESRKEAEAERRADQERDDRMEKTGSDIDKFLDGKIEE